MRLKNRSVWVLAKGFAPDEGGHQTYAEQVALAYSRLGANVTVVGQTSAGPREAFHGPLKLIDIGAGKSPIVLLRLIAAIKGEAKKSGRPDIVHATTWRTAVPAIMIGFRPVVTFHGREFMFASGAVRYVMERVIRQARLSVAVSHYSAARLKERAKNIAVEPLVAWNGASIKNASANKADNPLVILSLCRLEQRKNILNAVKAAATLRDQGFLFRYYICGRGPETTDIALLIDRLHLGTHVELLGFVSNEKVAELYASASIFLHPHVSVDDNRDFEGFGIVIADAMVAECAVVIGASGGAPELVEHELSGIVVDGNDVSQIAKMLIALFADRDGMKKMALAGRLRALKLFDWDRHVRLILDSLDN